jgi:putative membrane protein
MQTLVICIDRDNDLGEKAHINTPVIGRKNNIDAAVKLATADPEDSDTNTIFGGIQVLDDLLNRGIDAEIVLLAGDRNVNVVADQHISRQLDEILKTYKAKNAIFISDGAEDETLMPIVQSRIKIDSVKRVTVMQSANLESTYYLLKHAFNDPKISQTFFVPLGLAALIYAIFLLMNYPEGAVIGILAAVGLYMLYRGFNLDDQFAVFLNNVKNAFHGGRLTFVTYLTTFLIAIIATIQGTLEIWTYYTQGGIWYYGILTLATVFINESIWWYTAAFLAGYSGKLVDLKARGKSIYPYMSTVFFAVSMGLLFWGASTYLLSINALLSSPEIPDFGLQYFVYSIIGAFIIALLGMKISIDNRHERYNEQLSNTGTKYT